VGQRDHPARVAANLALVREALARAAAAGAPASAAATAALAVVEAWLRGDAGAAGKLESATQAAHADGQRRWSSPAPMAGSASWSCTAAGNLCWMAAAKRGWQNGDRSILDAAVYTVTSALPRDGSDLGRAQIRADLERVHAGALAGALVAPPAAKPPPRPRLRTIPDLARRVGPVAAAYMKTAGARIDPAQRGDAAAVQQRLAEHGFTAHAAVLAFEERWGGMILPRGREAGDWSFGAYSCVATGERGGRGHARRRLVPVACSPNDVVYFLDATGAAWGQDTVEEPSAVRVASDGDHLIATIVLFERVFAERLRKRLAEADGLHGARVARSLKLPGIRQATDAHVAFWGDGKTLVAEVREGTERTMVCGSGWKRAVPLLAR
jgi:hypothetical protein